MLLLLPVMIISIVIVIFSASTLAGLSQTSASYLISVSAFVPSLVIGLGYFALFRYGLAKSSESLYKNME